MRIVAVACVGLLWLGAASAADAPASAGVKAPRPAPALGIQTGPGQYTWLHQYAGKTVVVAFILTGCSHCQFTTSILNKLQTDYAARGVQVIASAIEPMSSLNIPEFRKKFSPLFPVGYNEQSYAMTFLGLKENDPMFMPQIVVVDRRGLIRAQFAGDDAALANDVQEKNLREAVERAIKMGLPASRPTAPK